MQAEKATSHAGGEASATDMAGVGGAASFVKAGCEKKREVLERQARSKPAGGSKILPELESSEQGVALLHGKHPTARGARATVLLLAGSSATSGPCQLDVDPAARQEKLRSQATFKLLVISAAAFLVPIQSEL